MTTDLDFRPSVLFSYFYSILSCGISNVSVQACAAQDTWFSLFCYSGTEKAEHISNVVVTERSYISLFTLFLVFIILAVTNMSMLYSLSSAGVVAKPQLLNFSLTL